MRCTRCIASDNSKNINYYKGVGNNNSKLMFVGECFGKTECETGIPFSGSAGNILDKGLDFANIKREDIFITNAVRCYTENKTPTVDMLRKCFIHLNREIQKVNPDLIIALGASAFMTLTDYSQDEYKYCRGRIIYSEKINKNIYIVYHPAAILYDNSKRETFFKDLKSLNNIDLIESYRVKNYDYMVVDSGAKLSKMLDSLKNNIVGFDIETDGLDSFNEDLNIKIIQLGNEENIFILTKKIIYENIDKIKNLLENSPIVGQDFTFDVKWVFNKLNIFPKLWEFDTCLAEYLISGMKNNSLVDLTGKYNPNYYGYWSDIEKAGGAHKIQDIDKLYQYAANDIGTLFPIMRKQKKTLFISGQYDYFKNIMMPCNKVLTKMSLRGVKIDLDTLWKLDAKYEKMAKKAAFLAETLPGIKECEKSFGKKFNHRSPDMIRWLLINYYKLPVLKKTNPSKTHPDGQAKVSQDELEIYAKGHKGDDKELENIPPFKANKYCKQMENYRSINTVRKNFLSGTVPKLKDGIAHTNYSLHATTTSRPNSKDPNLLNLPSKKEYLDIKKCYTARDGFELLAGDKSQIEVRVASVIYYDKNLIELCNEEGRDDFHSVITAKVFDVDYDDIYIPYSNGDKEASDKRRICKSITFGILYGMGKYKLAYQMGVSIDEAERFIRDYFDMFPDLEKEIEKTKKFVIKNGYVDTYFGFRRFFKDHSEEDHKTLREAVNMKIQGTAWNLMQLSLIGIDQELEKNKMESKLIMQVYDSSVVEAEKSEVEEVAKIMTNVMTSVNKPYPVLDEVKIKIDLERGTNLFNLEKY